MHIPYKKNDADIIHAIIAHTRRSSVKGGLEGFQRGLVQKGKRQTAAKLCSHGSGIPDSGRSMCQKLRLFLKGNVRTELRTQDTGHRAQSKRMISTRIRTHLCHMWQPSCLSATNGGTESDIDSNMRPRCAPKLYCLKVSGSRAVSC